MLVSLLALVATVSAVALPEPAALEERQTCRIATSAELSAARAAFLREGIIPPTPAQFDPAEAQLIPDFNPVSALAVSYGNKAVNLGNNFSTVETVPSPNFSFTREPNFDPTTTKYTLIMADPDAPNSETPILAPFLHLIVSDVQPDCIATQRRKIVAPYMFPTPLSVAPHHYTFLIYRQPPNYVPPAQLQNLPGLRARFPLVDYVRKNGLIGPIAGNFYNEGLGNVLDIGV
ncbi:hypothetical protein CKM354_000066700 [Cercospora kikuchii]|uniref:PEBP-like protein n=1 Tax=Cercospora kikuchii TaxID=84275 RepID=A0A9P3CEF4_9PEZI|nr:uncharacterized protein CKM354_000066700 [Cercospora kikuchii]GIZ37213.1 hypothetical protein CKM354_000066700 [Cercospora kikuchii]